MGLQCAKPIEHPSSRRQESRDKTFQAQMRKIKEIALFQIKINNLRLLNFPKSFQNIKIRLLSAFAFNIPLKDFYLQDNLLACHSTYLEQFETSIQSLSDKYVQFWLEEKGGRMIEVLRLKVHELFRGPVKHDHLIRDLKARLLFDFHIDQYVLSGFILKNCQIQWKGQSHHSDYTYHLSLMIGNTCSPVQTSKVFQKHEKIKEISLNNIKNKSSQLRDAIIRIKVVDNTTELNVMQSFLPLSKLQQQNGFKTIIKQQVAYEYRQIQLSKELIAQDETIGEVHLQIRHMKSKLYAEQMECVILSQNGIVMHTLTESPTRASQRSKKLSIETILNYIEKLQSIKINGITEYQLYTTLQDIFIQIQDKRFLITDQLFKAQQSLLNFLFLLAQFLQPESQANNEYIWETINHLTKQPILKLKYFCGIKNQHQKLIFAKRFYRLIGCVLKKIMKFTQNGLTYKQFVCIHKFIAFTYFRFPWCQEELIKVLRKQGDPIISQEKMAQIGASYALKSPSKNYFYDWQGTVYKTVKKDEQCINLIKQLNQVKKQNQHWAKLLFNREYQQLFLNIYSQLWDQAQSFLNNNGRILWQYFPKYGQLLEIFFGEINNSKIMDFSPQMTKCSMKLIKNEKLLTSFMMLIFPKTHLFQTNCVIKCLNLIQCYFNSVLNDHQMLPNNFHYNYFYTGVRSILDSQHSYLLQKILAIIYKFYNIFTKQFKQDLNKFIKNKVFYKLFLHWSQDVRNIFHLLLIFKVFQSQSQQNPENSIRRYRCSDQIQIRLQYEHMIASLIKRQLISKNNVENSVQRELFQKMKAKIQEKGIKSSQITKATQKEQFSENSILRKCSFMANVPSLMKRKWSVAQQSRQFDGLEPVQSELKYMNIALKQFQAGKNESKPDQKVDKRSKMFQFDIDE